MEVLTVPVSVDPDRAPMGTCVGVAGCLLPLAYGAGGTGKWQLTRSVTL